MRTSLDNDLRTVFKYVLEKIVVNVLTVYDGVICHVIRSIMNFIKVGKENTENCIYSLYLSNELKDLKILLLCVN